MSDLTPAHPSETASPLDKDPPASIDVEQIKTLPAAESTAFFSPEEVAAMEILARRRYLDQHHHPVGLLPAVQSLLFVLIVALFLTTLTVQPIRIPSGSMEPTLLIGDFLLLDRQAVSSDNVRLMPPTGVKRGDVVVFHDPIDDPSIHLVKRIIGLPGDRVSLHGNRVFVNDRPLLEPYAVYRPSLPDTYRDNFPDLSTLDGRVDPAWWIRLRTLVRDGELTVPAGRYFVLGDNRNESDDSRYWGFVPHSFIVGEPVLVYFSWRQPDTVEPQSLRNFARWDRLFHVIR